MTRSPATQNNAPVEFCSVASDELIGRITEETKAMKRPLFAPDQLKYLEEIVPQDDKRISDAVLAMNRIAMVVGKAKCIKVKMSVARRYELWRFELNSPTFENMRRRTLMMLSL